MEDSSRTFEIIYSAVNSAENRLSVSRMCEIAGVSRSGYYAWIKAEPSREKQELQDRKDFELILAAYRQRGYSKGARGVYMSLLHMNPPIVMNLKKIRRLMAKALKTSNVAENLLQRQFEDFGPRIVLLTDVTYLPYNGTFAYLSTILDAYTKQILAYVVSDSLQVDFVLETVENLIRDHRVSLHKETILHSDQGYHYTCYKFIDILRDKELRQSMSRKGNCWDNAPQESFFGHMKDHIGSQLKKCTEFSQVKKLVDDYIDYYNNERYQWNLAKLSPNEFYQFYMTGEYPIKISNPPQAPQNTKDPKTLGSESSKKDS